MKKLNTRNAVLVSAIFGFLSIHVLGQKLPALETKELEHMTNKVMVAAEEKMIQFIISRDSAFWNAAHQGLIKCQQNYERILKDGTFKNKKAQSVYLNMITKLKAESSYCEQSFLQKILNESNEIRTETMSYHGNTFRISKQGKIDFEKFEIWINKSKERLKISERELDAFYDPVEGKEK